MGRNTKYFRHVVVISVLCLLTISCVKEKTLTQEEIVDRMDKLAGLQIGDTITNVKMKLLEDANYLNHEEGEDIYSIRDTSSYIFGIKYVGSIASFEEGRLSSASISIKGNKKNRTTMEDSLRKYLGSPDWYDSRKWGYGNSVGLEWVGKKVIWRFRYDNGTDYLTLSMNKYGIVSENKLR